ncbi:tetratricopeptide repeat protein, partial [Micromonospora sp. NPDC000207]|uniref:tetratricopeptide repeat protein n=1 Tax=Micromonospora sp. NPDC000207 TaxID=3154246 RepID=UPI00331FC929
MSQPSPLSAARHRALALRDSGDLAGARRLLTDVVESYGPGYGADHPDVLGTGRLLAQLHREADDPMAARRVLEEAWAAGERRWSPAEPLMLAISFELASVAEELGNRHEARRNYTRVVDHGPDVLGPDHPTVQAARRYLGLPGSPSPTGSQVPPATTSGYAEPTVTPPSTPPLPPPVPGGVQAPSTPTHQPPGSAGSPSTPPPQVPGDAPEVSPWAPSPTFGA